MKIRIEYHRGAGSIVNEPNLKPDYEEILTALEELEEGKLLEYFLGQKQKEIKNNSTLSFEHICPNSGGHPFLQ